MRIGFCIKYKEITIKTLDGYSRRQFVRFSKGGADRPIILADIDETMRKHNILIFFLTCDYIL